MVPPKRRLTLNGLHRIISQKIELLMIMNDELEATCKESVVACFKRLFKLLLKVRYIVFRALTMLFSCTDYVGKMIINF
jgi:hypothetical protein